MKAQEAITKVVSLFEAGNLPKAMAYSMHPAMECPSNAWSFNNRIIMYLSGTLDARGFRQWLGVGRFVKKGAKCIYIIAPNTRKKTETNDSGDKEEKLVITGFRACPVFRYEDTDGEELEYNEIPLPDLPLLDIAEYLGVTVVAIPDQGNRLGYYSHKDDKICLATDHESVFFHELSHAVDKRLRGLTAKAGQQLDREIIAELSACTLAYMVNKSLPESMGNHFEYIKRYAEKESMNVLTACNHFFTEVENVVNEIQRISEKLHSQLTGGIHA
ncbi:MAG: antirestriction protein [PVC group bacterium]|nr:antirestriction protein [PVC group bacterium]